MKGHGIIENYYHYSHLMASFSSTTHVSEYQKGKTSLDLTEARDDRVLGWQWHQLNHMLTICTSFQPHRDNHTNTSSLNFYRQDALPDAKPTVSKHLRQTWYNTKFENVNITEQI